MTPFLSDWWYVDVADVPPNTYNDLTLLVNNPNDMAAEQVYVPIWAYANPEQTVVAIPRYCSLGLKLIQHPAATDTRSEGEPIDIELRPEFPPRNRYQEQAILTLMMNDHGIVQAKTGFGKTYVAINAITQIKRKTLILVHKSALIDQWINEFARYTTLTKDDICVIGERHQDLSKPILITTVQNLIAKMRLGSWDLRNALVEAQIGLTFFDECHVTAAAEKFAMASRWVFSKRIFGLSATPQRGDTYDLLKQWVLGSVIYVDTREAMPVFVHFVPYQAPITDSKYLWWLKSDPMKYALRYQQHIKSRPEFINCASDLLLKLIREERHTLAVAGYKLLLNEVFSGLKRTLLEQNISVHSAVMCHGTTELEHTAIDPNTARCVISTLKYFDAGLSLDWLDTLVYMSSPSVRSESAIPQMVGRIMREYPGKSEVHIYDLVNVAFSHEKDRMAHRSMKYQSLGYLITR
jgi:superfamily II DNA or RNA helicase